MMESVKDLKEVGGKKIMTEKDRPLLDGGEIDWNSFDLLRKEMPVCIDHKSEMISFKMMTKPASEGGSGCQITDLVEVALHQLKYLDGKFPCRENKNTISCLEGALSWQKMRTKDREKRKVEGKNEA